MSEQTHADNLKKSRLGSLKNSAKNAKKNIKDAVNVLSLMAYFNPFMDWLFGIALALAILKDILDFTGIGSLPGIGTVITLAVSFTIAGIMFLTGSASKIKISKQGKKFIVLIGGTFIELIFGIDFVPIETFMVIYIFYLTLRSRRESAQENKQASPQQAPAMA